MSCTKPGKALSFHVFFTCHQFYIVSFHTRLFTRSAECTSLVLSFHFLSILWYVVSYSFYISFIYAFNELNSSGPACMTHVETHDGPTVWSVVIATGHVRIARAHLYSHLWHEAQPTRPKCRAAAPTLIWLVISHILTFMTITCHNFAS